MEGRGGINIEGLYFRSVEMIVKGLRVTVGKFVYVYNFDW